VSTSAVIMMIVAMLILWGGLAVAIVNLNRSADVPREEELHRDL
jgi:cell division protein FtsX